MKKILFYSLVLSFGLTACNSTKNVSSGANNGASNAGLNKEAAVLWQQTAAEYDALCYQAFNVARYRLDVAAKSRSSQLVVIMDLDETVLDNSPYNGYLIKNNKEFERESWNRWVRKASADLVPGAGEFIDYAEKKGAVIYYVSNRSAANTSFTIQNLQKHNINVDPKRLLLSENGVTQKENRRTYVTKINSSDPTLLIGDNLADFAGDYEIDIAHNQRQEITYNFRKAFGNIFIMLPNPMYGAWEKALKYVDPMITDPTPAHSMKYLESFE